ncbi:hypothetical protein [Streptomyces melanogenes]|uniref:hypothetical protein n=1 Tax=Streptomyces melanogenes TaxID=67326 RepID=UPI00167C6AA9|nr:hypothetical protein [Streptomyces melanogenes]GGP33421.1 hypothetical protein GCM10010278_07000 [Streptomyces melanogenes]
MEPTEIPGNQPPLPYVCAHMRARTEEHRDVDFAVASVAALLDLLLIGFFLMVGCDGIWTADWMGSPGPVDSTGASYQGDVVRFAGWACAATTLFGLVSRCWVTAATQLVLLGGGALFLASLPTYWNP